MGQDTYFVRFDWSHAVALEPAPPGYSRALRPAEILARRDSPVDRDAASGRVLGFPFKPLAAPERFRVIDVDWRFRGTGPTSYVEVPPPNETTYWERDACGTSLVTREAALAHVGRLNQWAWAAFGLNRRESIWFVALEIGEAVPVGLVHVELSSNGIGIEDRAVGVPVRLVWPTADELRQYVI